MKTHVALNQLVSLFVVNTPPCLSFKLRLLFYKIEVSKNSSTLQNIDKFQFNTTNKN